MVVLSTLAAGAGHAGHILWESVQTPAGISADASIAYVSLHALGLIRASVGRIATRVSERLETRRLERASKPPCLPDNVVLFLGAACFCSTWAQRYVANRTVRQEVAVRQRAAPPLMVPIADAASGRWYMYVRHDMPPYYCKPVTLENRQVKWEVLEPVAVSRPNEKQVNFEIPRLVKEIFDVSPFQFLLIVGQGDSPVAMGVRVNACQFLTAFHVLEGVAGQNTFKDFWIMSVVEYQNNLDEGTRFPIEAARSTVQILDCDGARSRTGFDQALVSIPEVTYARAGVRQFSGKVDTGLCNEVYCIGPDPMAPGAWRPLIKNAGRMVHLEAYASVMGTYLHTINTVPGWSGTPVFKSGSEAALMNIVGLHIAATPGKVPFNVAISSPMLNRLLVGGGEMNCPFTGAVDLCNRADGHLEGATAGGTRNGLFLYKYDLHEHDVVFLEHTDFFEFNVDDEHVVLRMLNPDYPDYFFLGVPSGGEFGVLRAGRVAEPGRESCQWIRLLLAGDWPPVGVPY